MHGAGAGGDHEGARAVLAQDAEDAALVFRVADWLCERQLDANGAFLANHGSSGSAQRLGYSVSFVPFKIESTPTQEPCPL